MQRLQAAAEARGRKPRCTAARVWGARVAPAPPGSGPTLDQASVPASATPLQLPVSCAALLHHPLLLHKSAILVAAKPAQCVGMPRCLPFAALFPSAAAPLLAHSSRPQVVIDVEPLESGRSADLTGRLMVTVRDALPAQLLPQARPGQQPAAGVAAGAASSGVAPGMRHFCYRLGETGARYIEQVV